MSRVAFATFDLEERGLDEEQEPDERSVGITTWKEPRPAPPAKTAVIVENSSAAKLVKPMKSAKWTRRAKRNTISLKQTQDEDTETTASGRLRNENDPKPNQDETTLKTVPSTSSQGFLLNELIDKPTVKIAQADKLTSTGADGRGGLAVYQGQEHGSSLKNQLKETDVLKHITIREQYIKRLRRLVWTTSQNHERLQFLVHQKAKYRNQPQSMADQQKLILRIQELQKQMSALFKNIRDVTCATVEAIIQWRKSLHSEDFRSMKSEPRLYCFKYNDQNYLRKITNDLEWLDNCPFMADWLGFELKDNCLIVPPVNLDVQANLVARRAELIKQRQVERLEAEEARHRRTVAAMRMRMKAQSATASAGNSGNEGKLGDTLSKVPNAETNPDREEDDEQVVDSILMTMVCPTTQLVKPLEPRVGANVAGVASFLFEELAVQDAWNLKQEEEAYLLRTKYNPFKEIVRQGGVDEILDEVFRKTQASTELEAAKLRHRQEDLQRAKIDYDYDSRPPTPPETAEGAFLTQSATDYQTAGREDSSVSSSTRKLLQFDKEKLRVVIAARNQKTEAFSRQDPQRVSENGRGIRGTTVSYNAKFSAEELRREQELLAAAAVSIQSAFRGRRGRLKLNQEQIEMRQKAATSMQSVFRGHRARMVSRVEREVAELESEEVQAVCLIQASYRGHVGRRDARLEMLYRFGHDEDQEQGGSDSLESRTLGEQRRRMKERRDLEQAQNLARRRAREESAREQRQAATHIQSRYREHAALKQEEAQQMEESRHQAAVAIQSGQRGRLARRYKDDLDLSRRQEEGAVLIQSTFRGHQSRVAVEDLGTELIAQRSDAENAALAANQSATAAGVTAIRAEKQAVEVASQLSQNLKLPPVYRKKVALEPPEEVPPHPTHRKVERLPSVANKRVTKSTGGRTELKMANAEFDF